MYVSLEVVEMSKVMDRHKGCADREKLFAIVEDGADKKFVGA